MTETCPESGGDTLFANMYAAYDKLSPPVQDFFRGQTAITRVPLQFAPTDGSPRPKAHSHPIVRTHPVTGWQAIYANEPWTAHINGLGFYEARHLMGLLTQHVQGGVDFQIRHQWQPNRVAIWDNRVVQHVGIRDYGAQERRCRRVEVHGGEKPYFDLEAGSQAAAYEEVEALPRKGGVAAKEAPKEVPA